MKAILHPSLPLAAALAALLLPTSCLKETSGAGPGERAPLVSVELSLDEKAPDGDGAATTKSLVSVEAESFQKAALFAFDASSGRILLDGGTPLTKVTTTKTLSWSLPAGVTVDLYTLANYGDLDLTPYLSNASLRESDLEALRFSCPDGEAFAALGRSGYGIPMAGVAKGVLISAGNGPLTLEVKRLFARYDFFFDTAPFAAKGYTVHAVYIASGRSNTEVPFFVEGFGQSAPSRLVEMDYGTSADLTGLDQASRSHAATLYFLENCQGNKSGAAHWWEVPTAGLQGLDRCSYIDLGIRATDPDGNDMTFYYWIYLGDDCTTNFDVRRNSYRTIKLTMQTPDVLPPTRGLAIIRGDSVLENALPGGCRLYFETNLSESEISASASKDVLIPSLSAFSATSEKGRTAYPHSGYIDVAVSPSHDRSVAISGNITVGKRVSGSWPVSDEQEVSFSPYVPTVTYEYSVDITPKDPTILMEEHEVFSATLYRQEKHDGVNYGDPVAVSADFTWSTSDSDIAYRFSGSDFLGNGIGTAIITAACSQASGSTTLTVEGRKGFEWVDSEVNIEAGSSVNVNCLSSSPDPIFTCPNGITVFSHIYKDEEDGYEYSGYVTFVASGSMAAGTRGIVTGQADGSSSDCEFTITKTPQTISLTTTQGRELSANGGTFTVNVSVTPSSAAWTLYAGDGEDSFLSFSRTSGTGNAAVTVTYAPNADTSPYTDVIYANLTSGDGSASLTFTLKAGSGSSVTHRQIDVWIETKTSYEAIGQASYPTVYYTRALASEALPCAITVTDTNGKTYTIAKNGQASDWIMLPHELEDDEVFAASVSPGSYTSGNTVYHFVPDN